MILYSTGNEIPEAGTLKGAEWNRRIHAEMKRLDATRYTTNGINGLMAGNDRMGEIMCQATGMTPEQLEAMQQPDEQNRGGADEINGMAEVMVGPLADAIATSPILEEMIGEFAAVNDIAGYNYLTALHEEDHIRHPNRVVLGTETFPADIVHLWDIVKRNPHVLGDFTWTGYDYLGEAGCGIFHYNGGVNFQRIGRTDWQVSVTLIFLVIVNQSVICGRQCSELAMHRLSVYFGWIRQELKSERHHGCGRIILQAGHGRDMKGKQQVWMFMPMQMK